MQSSLYKLFFVNDHVVTQVIKSEFVICHISDIAIISCTSLFIFHTVENHTNSQSEEFVNFSHPLCITFCQIVIDCNDMNSLTFQGI